MNTFVINRIYFKSIIYIPNLFCYYFYILHNFYIRSNSVEIQAQGINSIFDFFFLKSETTLF